MRRKWADDFWKLHKNMSCTFSLRLGWMVEGIREIINISRKGNKVINCIQNGNMTVNSPKEIGEEIIIFFVQISRHPTNHKLSHIKKDDHMLCSNYQPISLFSNLNEIVFQTQIVFLFEKTIWF